MPLLNTFFQYSIFVLLFICLLTIIFAFRNKKSKTQYNRSEGTDKEFHQLEEKLLNLQDENTSLEEKLRHLQTENTLLKKELQRLNSLEQENQHLNKVIAERNEKSRKWKQKKEDEEAAAEAAEKEVWNNLSQNYKTKLTLMNRPESRMFFYITESIKKISNSKDQDFYILFPQVNLYAFIDQNPNLSISEDKSELLLKVLGGKNVDFILCYCHSDHYPSDTFNFYFYTPILMVEIDGPGHFYPIHSSYQKTRKNDQLKNTLANELKLPLLRYRLRLPKGNIEATDKAGIHTALRRFFSDYNTKQTESIYYYDQNGALSKNQYYNPPIDQT